MILVKKKAAGGDSFGNQWDKDEVKELPDAVAHELLRIADGGFVRADAALPGVLVDGEKPDAHKQVLRDGTANAVPRAKRTVKTKNTSTGVSE